jgi:hypothetical protein
MPRKSFSTPEQSSGILEACGPVSNESHQFVGTALAHSSMIAFRIELAVGFRGRFNICFS